MKKQFVLGMVVVLFAVTTIFGFGLTRTQVASAQDEKIVCDWTLITMLYVSEHVYGHFPMTDVSNFEFGQYAPLFEAMMAEMEMEATPEAEMTEEAAMEATEEAAMEPTEEVEGMVLLAHGDIPGEPQACTDLRHELDAWFLDHFNMEMGM
jgi:hypothetical protein